MATDDIRIPAAERESFGAVTRGAEQGVIWDKSAWRKAAYQLLRTEGVARMTRVRDACREQSGLDGYMLSTEGPGRLPPVAPIISVITTDGASIRDNAENQRLLKNFSLASGASHPLID